MQKSTTLPLTLIFLGALQALFLSSAWAHGPTPQKSDHEVVIKASFDEVWEKVKAPAALCDWHPLAKRCEVNDAGDERVIELENGERFSEAILEVNEQNHIVYLRQGDPNVKALPVSSYSTRMETEDNGDGTVTVRWKARYYRGDTGNFPPEHLSDEAAVEAMNRWMKTGLEGLQEAFAH
ncbi:SRPBCC family protein [Methylohalobius crimeensis]|uniref:SRPBCC family protein n=1 Tax=Methylohalobius crimeensis TaxID=244365 RepID=UPI0003B381C0|nr:SRPBCC family protein [Methylohalobius crimeensis]